MKSLPRYLLIVFALAGDSTITNVLPMLSFLFNARDDLDWAYKYCNLAFNAELKPSISRVWGGIYKSRFLLGQGKLTFEQKIICTSLITIEHLNSEIASISVMQGQG